MDCLKTKGRTKPADCVRAAFPPRRAAGHLGVFPERAGDLLGEGESKQPRPTHLPREGGGEPSRINSSRYLLRHPRRIRCAPGSQPCERPSALRSIKSAGCSSQGQLELLGVCWVPKAADRGSRRRWLLCPLREEAGAVGRGVRVLLCRRLFWGRLIRGRWRGGCRGTQRMLKVWVQPVPWVQPWARLW